METVALPVLDEPAETSRWGDAPPPNFEEDELDILAFELWRLGSCPEISDEDLGIE